MSTTRPCASGCTLRGDHLATCDGTCTGCTRSGGHRKRCDGTCSGCLPRPADDGIVVCAWCARSIERDVLAAPDLVRHLHAAAQPSTKGAQAPGDCAGDPAERPVLSAALDAADELHATLASWAHLVLEEHPAGDRMKGPDESGVRRTLTTIVGNTPLAQEYGTYFRRSTVAGIHDAEATDRLVAWLVPILPWCMTQPWAGEMRHEVRSVVATNLARWPMPDDVEPATKVDIPCPRCDQLSLVYTPPRFAKQAFRVECVNHDCARVFSEDEFDRLKGLALLEAKRRVS